MENRIGSNIHVKPAVFPDSEDVDAVFTAEIQLQEALILPAFRNGELVDGIILIELRVIQNLIGGAADCGPGRELLGRINDFVGAVVKQEALLDPVRCLGNNLAGAKLLQQDDGDDRGLEILPDGHDAGIEILNAKRGKEGAVCGVPDLTVCQIRKSPLYLVFIHVNSEYLMVHVIQFACDVVAEASKSDQ